MTEIHEALRHWAKGLYPLEAGVELLIRAFDGRFASPSQPWVQQGDDPGWWWIDADQMTEDHYGALSGGETRLLRIAASLLGGPPVDLSSNLAGLDGQRLQLVLVAIAHANGGHEHSQWPELDVDDPDDDPGRPATQSRRSGSLYPWPDQTAPLMQIGDEFRSTGASDARSSSNGLAGDAAGLGLTNDSVGLVN